MFTRLHNWLQRRQRVAWVHTTCGYRITEFCASTIALSDLPKIVSAASGPAGTVDAAVSFSNVRMKQYLNCNRAPLPMTKARARVLLQRCREQFWHSKVRVSPGGSLTEGTVANDSSLHRQSLTVGSWSTRSAYCSPAV